MLGLESLSIEANLRRNMALLLCFLPGGTATSFLFLAIANGGEILGLSVNWPLNCSLLFVPSLTIVIVIFLLLLQESNR